MSHYKCYEYFNAPMLSKVAKTFVLISVSLGLSACAGMNGKFGCNARGTDSCTPIAKVDRGDFTKPGQQKTSLNINPIAGGYMAGTPLPGEPVRKSEDVQRVWIGPFIDTSGNYHEPSYIYFVSKKSTWIGVGAHEITSNAGGDA